MDEQVDAVEQRPAQASPVAGSVRVVAAAAVAGARAGTRVARSDEHDRRGEPDRALTARDADAAALERLPERLERRPRELGELVEEQHPAVRERDLAGARVRPAPDQTLRRDRVVRRAEGPLCGERPVTEPGDAADPRDLDRLLVGRGRQDSGQASRQHRLARARRPDHEHVVAARGGDLERPLRVALPPDVRQVAVRLDRRAAPRRRRRGSGRPSAGEELRHAVERRHAEHVDAVDERGLGGVLLGHDQPRVAGAPRTVCHRDRAVDRAQRAAQRELAADRVRGEVVPRQLVARGEHGDGQREVEARPRLAQVRGREVGGEPLERELEPRVEHRRAHALAGLAHGAVGQSDDGERREAAAEVDLDRDLPGGDSLDGECGDAREHASKLDRAAAHV